MFGYAKTPDEYDGYVDEILAWVRLDGSRDEIADKLSEIEVMRMGVGRSLESRRAIADKILDVVSRGSGGIVSTE